MRTLASQDDLFPIRDAASAELMAAKARRLHTAGIISKREREDVLRRARHYMTGAHPAARRVSVHRTTDELLLT